MARETLKSSRAYHVVIGGFIKMNGSCKSKQIALIVFSLMLLFPGTLFNLEITNQAVLVLNTTEQVKSVTGKLKLDLVRVWGGEDEEDENKFFRVVGDIVMDTSGSIYISDIENHFIKVFDSEAGYLRTIGRRGRGPGDLYRPGVMAFSPDGNLWVHESGARRMQCFTSLGKSIRIFKAINVSRLIGLTSKNEFIVYSRQDMFRTGTLVKILDADGKKLRRIGVYHDPYKISQVSESLLYRTDTQDCIYALNSWTPVIRKYTAEGKMTMAIIIETPFDVPYSVKLNARGNEIERVNQILMKFEAKNTGKKGAGGILSTNVKGRIFYPVIGGFDVDSKKRMFVVMEKRLKTPKERKALSFTWLSTRGIVRDNMDLEIINRINIYRIVVLNPRGKIVAAADFNSPSGSIVVHENRLFNVDLYNQQILEYRIQFKE